MNQNSYKISYYSIIKAGHLVSLTLQLTESLFPYP